MSISGEAIVARSIGAMRIEDRHGNRWQYHSRSDRHSKVACWAVLFDVMRSCELLREHVAAGKVGFGINHELRDFKQNRKKNLDLVVSKAAKDAPSSLTFVEYGQRSKFSSMNRRQRRWRNFPSCVPPQSRTCCSRSRRKRA